MIFLALNSPIPGVSVGSVYRIGKTGQLLYDKSCPTVCAVAAFIEEFLPYVAYIVIFNETTQQLTVCQTRTRVVNFKLVDALAEEYRWKTQRKMVAFAKVIAQDKKIKKFCLVCHSGLTRYFLFLFFSSPILEIV
jgi:hypothetical protein